MYYSNEELFVNYLYYIKQFRPYYHADSRRGSQIKIQIFAQRMKLPARYYTKQREEKLFFGPNITNLARGKVLQF